MESEWDDEAAFAGLDDAVVIQDEVAGGLLDESGVGPGFAFIDGDADVWPAVDPAVFDTIKHGQFVALQAQKRDAHDVVAAGIFHHGYGLAPGAAVVVRVDADDAGRAFVSGTSVKLGVAEEDAARSECDERAFGVPRVFRGGVEI